jgi:hypothetical protein
MKKRSVKLTVVIPVLIFILIIVAYLLIINNNKHQHNYESSYLAVSPTNFSTIATPTRSVTTFTPTITKAGLTITPLPTIPHEKAIRTVMSMYENSECDFPCWWGITPGKTIWQDAWQKLRPFAVIEHPYRDRLWESSKYPDYLFYSIDLNIPINHDLDIYRFLNRLEFVINSETLVIEYITVNTGNIDDYSLNAILNKYGEPESILIDAIPHQLKFFSGVVFYLFYPDSGFIASYFIKVDQSVWDTELFTVCFQTYSEIYIWAPQPGMDINKIASIPNSDIIPEMVPQLQRIDQVSMYTISSFYDYFSQKIDRPCLKLVTDRLFVIN